MAKETGYFSPWVGLTVALGLVTEVVGEKEAWTQVKQAIRDDALPARGLLDGIDGDLKGEWLSALMWDEPEVDILFFDEEKRSQYTPPAPSIAERIEVQSEKLQIIWSISVMNAVENDGGYEKSIYFKLGKKNDWERTREATKQRWEKCLKFAIRVGGDHVERTQANMAEEISTLLPSSKDTPTAVQTGLNKYFVGWANPDP